MPDTHYANRKCNPRSPSDAYAMIFDSVSHSAELLFVSRRALRSIPMMGINRSGLSCRTLLTLFVLLGASIVARCDTIEDSARELARKIAKALPEQGGASCEIRNVSSLQADEVARISQLLTSELRNRCHSSAGSGDTTIAVVVTLSENIRAYVWTAEIRQGDTSDAVLVEVGRSAENSFASDARKVILRSEKFWEGPDRVFDATIVNSLGGDPTLLLLISDGLLIRKVGSDVGSTVQIPRAEFITRDPAGVLVQSENRVLIMSTSHICSIDPDSRALIECHPTAGPAPGRMFEDLKFAPPVSTRVDRGDQLTTLQNSCGDGQIFLAAGQGDYTKPDTIQVVESTLVHGKTVEKSVSDFLHVPGPVMALQSDRSTTRAIVRNLQTGNYEAYRISISCGR